MLTGARRWSATRYVVCGTYVCRIYCAGMWFVGRMAAGFACQVGGRFDSCQGAQGVYHSTLHWALHPGRHSHGYTNCPGREMEATGPSGRDKRWQGRQDRVLFNQVLRPVKSVWRSNPSRTFLQFGRMRSWFL